MVEVEVVVEDVTIQPHIVIARRRRRRQQVYFVFLAQARSSARGLFPVVRSMTFSSVVQKPIISSGKLSQPVVMQKYV
jgi:hypothetical protein